jgi:hypothetical protein
MKRTLLIIVLPAAIAASFFVGCSAPPSIISRANPNQQSYVLRSEGYDTFGRRWEGMEAPSAQSTMLTRRVSEVLSYTGTITDIDYANREITLKDSQGQLQTFQVSQDVQRFNEAKIGDKVSVDFYYGFSAELRKPTAEEQQNPLSILQATGRTAPGEDPTGATARQIRAVVTVEALDRANQTITVKSPRGKHYMARVADPSRFDEVHIGDTIVITFTEAMVVSLTPGES